ncbi:MAG: hypothetical protein FWE36_06560 [Erysipelotrichales bacterium]|nr:hypothetical protein [Erysipelotrichales bacterium]
MQNGYNEKKMKILQKPENRRTYQEKLELVYDKYHKKQKIFYEEYVMMALANDEIYFCYNNTEYEIDHGTKDVVVFFIKKYNENYQTISEKKETYSSVIELLNQVRIDGKLIREIWNQTHFGICSTG